MRSHTLDRRDIDCDRRSGRVRSLMQPLLLHSFDDGERTSKHGIFGGLRCWGFGKENLD